MKSKVYQRQFVRDLVVFCGDMGEDSVLRLIIDAIITNYNYHRPELFYYLSKSRQVVRIIPEIFNASRCDSIFTMDRKNVSLLDQEISKVNKKLKRSVYSDLLELGLTLFIISLINNDRNGNTIYWGYVGLSAYASLANLYKWQSFGEDRIFSMRKENLDTSKTFEIKDRSKIKLLEKMIYLGTGAIVEYFLLQVTKGFYEKKDNKLAIGSGAFNLLFVSYGLILLPRVLQLLVYKKKTVNNLSFLDKIKKD